MFDIKCFATGSSGNSYLISKGKSHILIECGIPYNKLITNLSLNGLSLNDIDYCLVSHKHKDHSLCFNEVNKLLGNDKCFITQENEPTINFNIGSIKVLAISVNHGSEPCSAFILSDDEDTLLFATDFMEIEWNLKNFKFTQIMIECNYYEKYIDDLSPKEKRQINTHLGLNGLIIHLDSFDLSRCKEIYLIHLSRKYSDEMIMKATIETRYKIKTYVCQENGGIK